MAMKIKKGDRVVILSGKDKGKHGEVTKSMPKEGKVIVAGVNVVKRHQRQTQKGQGGIVSKESPIQLSNIAHVDPKTGKPTRVRFEERDGKKVRIAVRSGELING